MARRPAAPSSARRGGWAHPRAPAVDRAPRGPRRHRHRSGNGVRDRPARHDARVPRPADRPRARQPARRRLRIRRAWRSPRGSSGTTRCGRSTTIRSPSRRRCATPASTASISASSSGSPSATRCRASTPSWRTSRRRMSPVWPAALGQPLPRRAVLSGFRPAEAAGVIGAWDAAGFAVTRRIDETIGRRSSWAGRDEPHVPVRGRWNRHGRWRGRADRRRHPSSRAGRATRAGRPGRGHRRRRADLAGRGRRGSGLRPSSGWRRPREPVRRPSRWISTSACSTGAVSTWSSRSARSSASTASSSSRRNADGVAATRRPSTAGWSAWTGSSRPRRGNADAGRGRT